MTGNRKKIAVAIYQSGQSRKDLKIPENIKSWTKFKNYRISKVYRDDSKGKILDRPGFKAMIEDAQARKFEIIITSKLTNFGKSLTSLHQVINILKANSIGLNVIRPMIYVSGREHDDSFSSALGESFNWYLDMFIAFQRGKLK